jgi:hypothetical protein
MAYFAHDFADAIRHVKVLAGPDYDSLDLVGLWKRWRL